MAMHDVCYLQHNGSTISMAKAKWFIYIYVMVDLQKDNDHHWRIMKTVLLSIDNSWILQGGAP